MLSLTPRTPAPLQVHCYDGSDLDQPAFAEWFRQFTLPSGKQPNPQNADTLIEICGPQIGVVHTPTESAEANDVGWVFVGVDARDGLFKCYAAVRLTAVSRTVVIDLLGVHDSIRRQRVGGAFYHAVMGELGPRIVGHFGVGVGYSVSLQSTFDYDSYTRAVFEMSTVKTDAAQHVVCAFNKDQIIRRLSGACLFWRHMGFNNSRLVFSKERGITDPILIMWKNE
jgi:hypothetical protein